MKTLRIFINCNAIDGYLYGGRLFLICNDGSIKVASLWKIIASNIQYGNEEYKLFKLAFDRNNWLSNSQANNLLALKEIEDGFRKLWSKYSKISYDFKINDEDLTTLSPINSMPVFDFRIYGMRLFLGNRTGLYEAGISLNGDSKVRLNESLDRVFDCRTTGISPKSGTVMISSNSDGLFHGQLREINQRLSVIERPVVPVSLRACLKIFFCQSEHTV